MPTMPLNQLTSLSEALALRVVKMDAVRRHTSPIEWQPHFAWASAVKGDSPHNVNAIPLLGWLSIVWSAITPHHRLFVLQLRNGLGTVPENDFTPLQQRAARCGCCRFVRCGLGPLLLQHPKCAGRPLRWFANWPKL